MSLERKEESFVVRVVCLFGVRERERKGKEMKKKERISKMKL
jgi:hypothetical protein